MSVCEVCGNDYDKAFEVVAADQRHVFDSFECAIQLMAPVCEHCGCKVIGHGTEVDGHFFCCAHCARQQAGTTEIQDRDDRVDLVT
jgi:Rieske Fe-S protein